MSSLWASWQGSSVCVVLVGMSGLEWAEGGWRGYRRTRPPPDLAALTKWTRSITLDGPVTVS